mgnify:CR=1 FL=1
MKFLLIDIVLAGLLISCKTTTSESKPPPKSSLHHAAHIGDIENVKQHLDIGTDPNLKPKIIGWSPLAEARSMDIIVLLVDAGANVNDVGNGETALPRHYYRSPEIIRFLVSKGVDVNAVDNFGNTALHEVVDGLYPRQAERAMARVNILIEAGARINATDKDGMTVLDRFLEGLKIPFMKRETYKEQMSAMLKLLLSRGAKTAEQLKAEVK